MSTFARLAVAFGAGALAMYFFDPALGRSRRAFGRYDVHASDEELDELNDLEHADTPRTVDRLRDASARARAEAGASSRDGWLRARVRSLLDRRVARPGDVGVDVDDGLVVLSGHVKVSELDGLIDAVAALPGVYEVESQLTTRVEGAVATEEERSRH